MKKVLITVLFFSGVVLNSLHAQVTLEGCREAARLNFPLIDQYKLLDLTAEYKIENINKSYLPQLSISAKASFQSEVTKVPINIPGMVISPLDKDQYGAVIQADQVIWDGGAGKAQKESVIKTTISDKKRLDTEIYQVYERVNQLFFGIILIDENLKISQLYIDELNRGLEKVKSGEQTGLANQSDVDAVNVELLNVMQKETELKSNRRAFLNMLNAMTGSKISADEVFKVPEISENDLNDRNLRPELEAFDAQKALILSQKNLVDAKNMLKLGAFIQGGYGKPGLNMLKNNFDSYFIGGIRLSWNFGGYYTRKNEIAQIKVNSQQVEIQKNVFLYNLNLKNSQQIENIKKIKTMIITDNNIIELRKRISAASEAKLDNGTISVSDYLSELSKLDIARRVKSAREIEYLSALCDYKNTLNN